ncbi:MAG: hypothetical protein JRE23_05375 [Deltaproteobacteria bacterium]|nr:hypothetical protein [Deltaproteobacteria bacterium]
MMSKQNLQIYLAITVLFLVAACSTGPNSSPGGAVVLAMDAIVHKDIQTLVQATYGSRSDYANPREIGNEINKIVEKFSLDHNAKITIGRTFKKERGQKADVYFSITQNGVQVQFIMKAKKMKRDWVAILDSLRPIDKQLW